MPDPLCNPCLDQTEAPQPGTAADYRGGKVYRFAADVAFDPCEEDLVSAFTADPVLILLPAGRLQVDDGTEYMIHELVGPEGG